MSEAKTTEAGTVDLLDELAGVKAGTPLAALRQQRADIGRLIQANYDVLLEPEDDDGVTYAERGLIALRVAFLDESEPLIEHYQHFLARYQVEQVIIDAAQRPALDAPLSPRLIAMLAHVDLLTDAPHLAMPGHLTALKRHGLTDANIVTISQLIAFISFQVRVLAGLHLLGENL